jgi:tetratricopeptide (TPR) repeat protein
MALSEIEKLERRYAENPHGLTFAPLAEVHRKNGDVPRALELLKPGLQNHPDYIPASIVLGRCHLDLGDLPAAETAFTHVLALDGENVIALKALADISERLHRFDDAERWLNSLLSLDRSNDEARDQLARLQTARRSTEGGSPATEAKPAAETVEAFEQPAAALVAEPSAPSETEVTPLALEELEPARLADFDAPPSGLERDETVLDTESIEPISDLVGQEVDFAQPPSGDFRVETSEDIVLESSGGNEFQVPDASQELFSRAPDTSLFGDTVSPPAHVSAPGPVQEAEPEPAASRSDDSSVLDFDPVLIEAAGMVPPREDDETEPEPAKAEPMAGLEPLAQLEPVAELEPEPAVAVEPEPAEQPAASPVESAPEPLAAIEPLPAAESPAPEPPAPPQATPAYPPPEPEPVVTETMAEVLLHQGHAAEALAVYRELANRSGDPRLQQRVAELESARPAPLVVRYSAKDTGGRSVAETLRAILGASLPSRPSAPPVRQAQPGSSSEGAPTRPAAEALSLSSVFGEETPTAPPAVPSAPAERVSFDDFYGSSSPTQTPRGPRAAEPKSDDLDEFHTWLQNLKR